MNSTFSHHSAEDSKVSDAVSVYKNDYGNLIKSLCIMLLYEQEILHILIFACNNSQDEQRCFYDVR